MGKKDRNKVKGKGAEKTAIKTDKKLAAKQKKLLAKLGEKDIAEVVLALEEEERRLKLVQETVCQPPSPRSNFSFVAHPEKEELILFGGEFYNGQKISVYNDLFLYNIPKNEWKMVKSPSGPAPRSGHQMVSVGADGGQLWLFGGEHASPSQMQYFHYKDLWCYRLGNKSWEKINAPNGPSPRSGHRMVASKKKLIVFGGFYDNNSSYKYFNDVHVFSLEHYTWLKVAIEGTIIPAPRSGCCIAANTDGKIYIWGGYTKSSVKKDVDKGVVHTDMFTLSPDKCDPNKFKWSSLKPSGYKPLPRSSIGFTVNANNRAYCFGGVMDVDENEEEVNGQFGDELAVLDLTSNTWRLIEIGKKNKEKPESTVEDVNKASSSTTSSDGIFTITVSTPTSTKSLFNLKPKFNNEQGPTKRMNPGLCVCKGTLYVYGGIFEDEDKQYTYNDFYSIDLHKLEEWKILIKNDQNAHDWIESGSSDSEDTSDMSDDEVNDSDQDDSDDCMDTD